jgi:hypothetical protein
MAGLAAALAAPTEGCSRDKQFGLVRILCQELSERSSANPELKLGWTAKKYRQTISALRASKPPPTPKKELEKVLTNRRSLFELACAVVNNTTDNSDQFAAIDSQFHDIVAQFKGFPVRKALCVCDTSPSMYTGSCKAQDGPNAPIYVSLGMSAALSSYVSTYSFQPTLVTLGTESFAARVGQLVKLDWDMSLDLLLVAQMAVEQGLDTVYVFTDDEFSQCEGELWVIKYENWVTTCGKRPQIIYFNLDSPTVYFNLDYYKSNLLIVNGFDPRLCMELLRTGTVDPHKYICSK